MAQLTLNITPCLSYSPDNFLLHQGVKATFDNFVALILSDNFRIGFIVAGHRCGKTHFSIKVADTLLAKGLHPRLIDGAGFGDWMRAHSETLYTHEDVLIVDDSQHYLSCLCPGDSGELVSFVERLRVERAALILLSSHRIEDYQFDDHVRSRLLPGIGFELGAPHPDDMPELLKLMARQRGLSLRERSVDFLEKRIPRGIAEIEAYLERLDQLSRVTGKRIGHQILGDAV